MLGPWKVESICNLDFSCQCFLLAAVLIILSSHSSTICLFRNALICSILPLSSGSSRPYRALLSSSNSRLPVRLVFFSTRDSSGDRLD
ncbi:hypothetical protein HD806DRAFT_476420 [Xylariaceae sp. AK1471]|nr:hypothetical protein HD806DRAFT_476420 [Xylariaceae sp. AK1471]